MPKGKVSAEQELLIDSWQGLKPTIVRSIDDALEVIGVIR